MKFFSNTIQELALIIDVMPILERVYRIGGVPVVLWI
jgi:hypothetical protein